MKLIFTYNNRSDKKNSKEILDQDVIIQELPHIYMACKEEYVVEV